MGVKIYSSSKQDMSSWRKHFNLIEHKGFYHDPDYIKFLEQYRYPGDQAELCIYEDGNDFIYYPYIKRNLAQLQYAQAAGLDHYYDIVTSWYYGGPIPNRKNSLDEQRRLADAFLRELRAHRQSNNIVSEFMRFDPLLKNNTMFEGILDTELCGETVYIDLTQDEQDIWNGFEGRNRTRIRTALKGNIAVDKNEDDISIRQFTAIYQREMQRKKAPQHYWFDYEYFKSMKSELGARFNLFLIKRGKEIIGGCVCVRQEGIAHDYLAACLPEYQRQHPNNLLHYTEMKWCKAHGDSILDLQGGRPGVFNFKKGFSQARGKFYSARIIHNTELYTTLVKVSGVASSTYFPAYRANDRAVRLTSN